MNSCTPESKITPAKFGEKDASSQNSTKPLEERILNGEYPENALRQHMAGPASYYCPNCDDEESYRSKETAAPPIASKPGERPLRGQGLVDFLKNNYPKGCGYKFPGFSSTDVKTYKKEVDDVIKGELPNCHASNCSTAAYMGILEAIKGTPHEQRLKGKLKMGGPLYSAFVIEGNGIERLFGDKAGQFNLGSFRKINRISDVSKNESEGWPTAGDIMILNRRNGSGHSVVFSHYSGTGNNKRICYWSSNKGTRGMGISSPCERLSRMSSLHIGRVE